jgi:hypothetical protein
MRTFILVLSTVAMASCATQESDKVTTAATTPLSDLNLVNAPIPETLIAAQQAPYALPASMDCAVIAADIRKLDEVLGPDLDAPVSEANKGLVERGVESAGGAAVGALQRTAEGVIPFRGWVRKLTGAERYSKRVAAAIAAGTVRRGFLKGLNAAQKCV